MLTNAVHSAFQAVHKAHTLSQSLQSVTKLIPLSKRKMEKIPHIYRCLFIYSFSFGRCLQIDEGLVGKGQSKYCIRVKEKFLGAEEKSVAV